MFSNIDYWRLSPDSSETLFQHNRSILPADCDVVATEHVYIDDTGCLPEPFAVPHHKYRTVFIDSADGWRTPALSEYSHGIDLVLKCHCSSRFKYGRNVLPWAFGLSSRVLNALKPPGSFSGREKTILNNFRSFHSVRQFANNRFLPYLEPTLKIDSSVETETPDGAYDRLMWEQSGRRHYPAYYGRLSRSAACSAFGGYFVPAFSSSLDSLALRAAYRVIAKTHLKTRSVAQFDSWRFWESLAAGCLTFHVDLSLYGCELPVMPRNGEHYFGIDLKMPKREAERILEREPSFETIAASGRRWAVENYTPEATARRFQKCLE